MAAPEVRAVGTIASGEAAISPGLPAGTIAGDLLIMIAESQGAGSALTAAGWSAAVESQVKGNTRLTILYKIAAGSDATTTNDTGDHQIARIVGVKAGTFATGTPINVSAVGTQAATKSVSILGATTTVDECLIVACASGNLPDATGTAEFGAATNASLSSITERIDNTSTAGDGGAIYCTTGIQATKGAYNATTLTAATEAERGVASIAIAPLVKGTVAQYEFSENLNDSVGSNNGTGVGSPTYGESLVSSEPSGHSLALNGSTQFIEIPNALPLQIAGSYWHTAWFYRGSEANEGWMYSKSQDFALQMLEGDGIAMYHVTVAGATEELLVGTEIKAGRIYRADAVYDGAHQILYLNGRKIGERACTTPPRTSTNKLYLGAREGGPSHPYNGKLDKIRFRNFAGTAAEILAQYREETPTVYEEGFETGDFSKMGTTQVIGTGAALTAITASPTPAIGTYAAQTKITGAGAESRVEMVPGHIEASDGDDLYVRLRFYLGAGFPISDSRFQVIWQLRDEGTGSPVAALCIRNSKMYVEGGPVSSPVIPETIFWEHAVETGRWYDICIRVKCKDTTEGIVQVWLERVKQTMLVETGVRTMVTRAYPKWGDYRDKEIAAEGITVHDGLTITRELPFAEVIIFEDSGSGTVTGSGSSSESAGPEDSGSGSVTGSGSGTDAGSASDSASGALAGSGSGTETAETADSGSGTIAAAGEGADSYSVATVPNRLRVTEYPPMRQYLLATSPGGRVERWSEDELLAANVIEGLSDSDSVPGGFKDMTGALPRKPGVDYHDMKVGTRIENFGAGQYKISEYRLERTPRTSGDYLVMNPAASGYQVLLSDNEGARALFLDSEMGAWGEPSARRRTSEEAKPFKLNVNAQVGLLPAGTPGASGESQPAAISHAWAQINNEAGVHPDIAESWYDSGGIELGEVLLDFVNVKGLGVGDTNWNNIIQAALDDVATSSEILHDFNATTVSDQAFAIAASRFFLYLQDYYGPAESGESNWEVQYRNIKVRDRSGLPLYGTWPNVGVLASDAIAYSLSRWAPGIQFTTGSFGTLKPSNFIIEHLAFKEPTTVQDIVTQALRFELLEWGVWSGERGPTFYLNPRGEREGRKRWRARVRPAKLTDTGQQMDQVWNKGVISFTGTDGIQRTVGPPGSGYQITDARCEDTDPLNPINEAGEDRTKHLALTTVATAEGAAEVMQRFLEQAKLLDGSGEATLTGYVEDEHGALWPYYCVHAGDLIDFIDSSIPGYRYIVEATRNRADRSVNIKIDSPPDSYAALLERLGVREVAAGVSG